jgi:hypothetical protein
MLEANLTENAIIFLFLGLIVYAAAIFRVVLRDQIGLLSLHFIFMSFIAIGYLFNPLWHLLFGGWEHLFLRPEFIETAILNAVLIMVAFWFGYALFGPRWKRGKQLSIRHAAGHDVIKRSLKKIRYRYLVGIATALLCTLIFSTGGVSELLASDIQRGSQQWGDGGITGRLASLANIISNLLGVSGAGIAAIYVHGCKKQWPIAVMKVLPLLFIFSIPFIESFSRMSGGPIALFAIISISLRIPWSVTWGAALIALGMTLSLNGYFMRSLYSPGVLNFFDAYFNGLAGAPIFTGPFNPNYINIFNAVDRFTLKASVSQFELRGDFQSFVNFIGIIQPLPSQLVGLQASAGASLTEALGTQGVLSITTPALGEIYHLFGYSGTLVFFFYGGLCGRLDRAFIRSNAIVFQLMRLLFIIGFASGLHKGFRAMTRPIVYAGLIYIAKGVRVYRKKKTLSRYQPIELSVESQSR